MENQSYREILKLNAELKYSLEEAKQYKVTILSNIIIHQIKQILEFSLRIENINAVINIGDYDNIIQDSIKVVGSNAVIIFWELCNLTEGLNYKIEQLEDDQINKIAEKTCSEMDLTFKNLETSSLVLVNKFSSVIFPFPSKTKSNFDKLANILNKHGHKKYVIWDLFKKDNVIGVLFKVIDDEEEYLEFFVKQKNNKFVPVYKYQKCS